MRERLDCAVMLTRCTDEWIRPVLGQHAGGRLHMHAYDDVVDIEAPTAHLSLVTASMALRRFDVCLLLVSPSTLSWARIALSQAGPRLQTPVMALVKDLTAAGLFDLHELGVADFVRDPFCSHDARIRIERLLDGHRYGAPNGTARRQVSDAFPYPAGYSQSVSDINAVCNNVLDYDIPELEAFAVAAASRSSTSRESFQEAKSKVIERFERAYITASLGRHGGNIAMAARAAQKHRRAFWQLMRKHGIDAQPFRTMAAGRLGEAAGITKNTGSPQPVGDSQSISPAERSRVAGGSSVFAPSF